MFTTSKGAKTKFMRKHGTHCEITATEEFADPAGLFKSTAETPAGFELRDCGSGQSYGICKVCGKGHGAVLMSGGTPSPAFAKA